jgi:hypothetical protein
MRFKDKGALINAAANGIGRATATIMAREGATVIAVKVKRLSVSSPLIGVLSRRRPVGSKPSPILCCALPRGRCRARNRCSAL